MTRRNCCAGPGSKVDAPEASAGPGWKIQEVSRVGAQGVTSKSKLLAQKGANVQQQRVRGDIHCSQRSRTSIPCHSPRTRPRRPAGAPPPRRRPAAPARKKKSEGVVDVATATECLHVSYVLVVISHAAGPAAPRHPPQRHVEQPAAPGRRAGRAAGRRDRALLRGEVDGPDRGDTVDEETAKRKGEDAPRRAVLHGAAAAGHRPGPSR